MAEFESDDFVRVRRNRVLLGGAVGLFGYTGVFEQAMA